MLVVTSAADVEALERLASAWRSRVDLVIRHDGQVAEPGQGAAEWTPDVHASLSVLGSARSFAGAGAKATPRRIDVEASLAVPETEGAGNASGAGGEGGAGRGRGSVGIVARAHWSSPDSVEPIPLGWACAAIYPRDETWRVEARARELAIRVFEQALRRVAADRARPTPSRDTPRSRPLTRSERLLWGVGQWWRRLRLKLGPVVLIKSAAAILILLIGRPVRDMYRSARRRHPVRVFTFHRVSDLSREGLTVSPRVFLRQLEYIRKHHRVVDIRRGLELLREDTRLSEPVALITFDDAYRSVREFGVPILAEVEVPGCCFVTTEFADTDRRYPWDADNPVRDFFAVMSEEELRFLLESGWTLGGHTATHPRLATCEPDEVERELSEPLRVLKSSFDVTEVPMAYPFGGRDDITNAVVERVAASGYTACFSNFGGENFPPADSYRLRRIDIGGDHLTLAWKLWVHGIISSELKGRMLNRVGRWIRPRRAR